MRKVEKIYNPNNVQPGMARVIYDGTIPVKQRKIVTNRRGVKTIDYSPISYYGKQKRTVTKSWK